MTQLPFASYDEYRDTQIRGNRKKIDRVWAKEDNIRFLARRVVPAGARFGVCHGTRRGAEQAWFRKYLPGCECIGTEISPTALQFPDTVCWDFGMYRADWEGRADFVYSNSHDHAREPEQTLRYWIGQLKPSGVLMLEHTNYHEQLTDYNCWAVGVRELCKLLEAWSEYTREVVVCDLPAQHGRGPKAEMYTKAVVLGARR